ncbi:MAG: septum formation initiator family protein [Candidatus Babeliales bacterium]
MKSAQTLLFIALVEVLAMGLWYVVGAHGLLASLALKKQMRYITQETVLLTEEITQIEEKLELWNHSFFYTEQIAREQLHMVYPHETLFLMKCSTDS